MRKIGKLHHFTISPTVAIGVEIIMITFRKMREKACHLFRAMTVFPRKPTCQHFIIQLNFGTYHSHEAMLFCPRLNPVSYGSTYNDDVMSLMEVPLTFLKGFTLDLAGNFGKSESPACGIKIGYFIPLKKYENMACLAS